MTFMLSKPEHRFLFIHIPKTGGTSIAGALKGFRHEWTEDDFDWWRKYKAENGAVAFRAVDGGHARAEDYAAFMQAHDYPVPLKVYSIVRNPWDKAVSGYHYSHQGEVPDIEFGAWMEWSYKMWNTDPIEAPMWHQHLFVEKSEYPITFLRFEDGGPAGALDVIVRELGLQGVPPIGHSNKSIRKPYREYYNQYYKDMIAEVFAKDIEMFGYEF